MAGSSAIITFARRPETRRCIVAHLGVSTRLPLFGGSASRAGTAAPA